MSDKYLFWVDMEMSGLDPETCHILEIASLVTDNDLNLVAEGPCLIVHQPDSVLDAMDEWNTEHHGKSGLTAKVRESKISVADAERQTLEFIAKFCGLREAILSGNSIGQDRRFIRKYMTELDAYLHYRMLDVSTIKILCQRWYGPSYAAPAKKEAHRALGDILESVAELKHYRERLFVKPADTE